MAKARRALVIGLDGMDPKYVKRFSEEGRLPNMRRLIRQGAFGRLVSAPPAQTPANWTCIATGAWPGTHGIVMWGDHVPGQFPANVHRPEAMSSNICTAEYLWEAAARAGKGSVLMNFVGHPPTARDVVHIDWFQSPNAYFFEIAPAEGYRTYDVGRQLTPLEVGPAKGWRNVPASAQPPLEATLAVRTKERGTPLAYHLLVIGGRRGYDRVLLSKTKDAKRAFATLRPGNWSDWYHERFELDLAGVGPSSKSAKGRRPLGSRKAGGRKRKRGTLRWKLIELSPDGKRLWLYHPQVIAQDEFVSPRAVGRELVKRFGPYINEAAWSSYTHGLSDEATSREEFAYFAHWVGQATKHLMAKRRVALYMQQLHLLDHVNHHYLQYVDPVAAGYSPEREAEGWQKMRLAYELADLMVGEVAKAARNDTVVFVVADHADTPNRRSVALVNRFLKKGWIASKQLPNGRYDYDYTKTKVYFDQLHLYVNLKGREPHGVVEPSEYDALREAVIDEMLALHDPKDGRRAIPLALKKEDALYFGVYGPGGGDVFFMYGPGFCWTGLEVLSMGEKRTFFDRDGANHGPQIPTAETAMSTNSGGFIAAGPGVRRGYARQDKDVGPAFTVDVAPTVADLIGIPRPAQAQGKVIGDILAGGQARKARRPKPIRFPVPAPRRAPRKKPVLKGDVTDET